MTTPRAHIPNPIFQRRDLKCVLLLSFLRLSCVLQCSCFLLWMLRTLSFFLPCIHFFWLLTQLLALHSPPFQPAPGSFFVCPIVMRSCRKNSREIARRRFQDKCTCFTGPSPYLGWLGYAAGTSPSGTGRITYMEAKWKVGQNPKKGGAFYSPVECVHVHVWHHVMACLSSHTMNVAYI